MKSIHRCRIAAALALIGGLALAGAPAKAQIGSIPPHSPPPPIASGGGIVIPASVASLGISPDLTVFQFRTLGVVPSGPNAGAETVQSTTRDGATIFGDKLFYLRPNRSLFGPQPKRQPLSAIDIGAWYWHAIGSTPHSSIPNNHVADATNDQLALYARYYYDNRTGLQASVGGSTYDGLDEYYGFVVYTLKTASMPKSPLAVDAGVGPYAPRASEGNLGYNALVEFSLKDHPQDPSDKVSYSASIWYVSYKAKLQNFNFSANNNTIRYFLGVSYAL